MRGIQGGEERSACKGAWKDVEGYAKKTGNGDEKITKLQYFTGKKEQLSDRQGDYRETLLFQDEKKDSQIFHRSGEKGPAKYYELDSRLLVQRIDRRGGNTSRGPEEVFGHKRRRSGGFLKLKSIRHRKRN